jgi:DNA-binding transcriptional MerR regulator
MRISELAAAAGCHLETVRYYEKIGLLPKAARSASGYRSYGASDRERLTFIVRSRALGFSLDEVRSLMGLSHAMDRSCGEIDAIARQHLADIEAKQRELAALADELRGMIDGCAKDTRATCAILRSLGGPVTEEARAVAITH